MTATREFALWAAIGMVGMVVFALVDEGSLFREPGNYWVVPVVGAVTGGVIVLRTRLMRSARRRGAEARGMTLEESEAKGREAERRFRGKHPVLYVLAWIGILALLAFLIWLRVTT